jgi:hypothetical protein
LALIFGALVGMPVLFRTVTFGEQPKLYADVVYAYFSLLPSNQSLPVLSDEHLVSFLFVLNVTNLSNEVVDVTSVDATAAGEITFGGEGSLNNTISNGSHFEWSNATQVWYQNATLSYAISDVIVAPSESFEGSEYYWQYYWPENSSKLVALSGLVDIPESSLALILNSKIFVFSHVEGKAYASGVSASGAYVAEGVQLETVGNSEFVFNELLKTNQTLQVQHDGTMVTIVSGT